MIKYLILLSLFTCSLCRLTEFYRWKQINYQHLSKTKIESEIVNFKNFRL